jgi:hypothetical protein
MMSVKTSTNGQPILTAAHHLCDLGYAVVPCDGKKAAPKEWQNRKLDRDELARWLKGTHRNIAICLNQSPLMDVEADTEEAESNLQRLFGNNIPPTPTWASKRGLHRLFVRPDGIAEKAKIEIDGIEFRIGNGRGACSVVPPSIHPDGFRYKWLDGLSLDDVKPAELPAHIVDRLKAPPVAQADPAPGGQEILEGKRNDTIFRHACALRELMLPPETICTTLLDLNQRLCKPPLPDDEVKAIVRSALDGTKPKSNFVTRLLNEIELWHDESDEPYATLVQHGHKENWRISKKSPAWRRYLSKTYYETTNCLIEDLTLGQISTLLEGKAVFDYPAHKVYRRVAEHDGKIFFDLCNADWKAVEIDADGWRIIDASPAKFRRGKAMQPLPIPVKSQGKTLRKLLEPFLNLKEEHWPLILVWLSAALRPRGPYAIVKLLGEQGSAKTTTARVLRKIIDPNAAPVRAEPREARDLMIASNNGWCICYDNLSTIPAWLSDALCRLSTGGGFGTRQLYTDEDEIIFDAMRPIIVTSIEEIGTRSDLMERSLILDLPSIPETSRRTEKKFWADFDKAQPEILGALLAVVSSGIRNLPVVEKKTDVELSRMADFQQWGEACEESLGLAPGQFAEAYAANREAATQLILESQAVCAALMKLIQASKLLKKPNIECNATVLLDQLHGQDEKLARSPGWPKTSRVLSQILRRVAPNLRQVGIIAVQDTRGGGMKKEKIWRITWEQK